jgi:hypothetical protein
MMSKLKQSFTNLSSHLYLGQDTQKHMPVECRGPTNPLCDHRQEVFTLFGKTSLGDGEAQTAEI